MALTEAKGASLRLDDDLASTATGKGASLVAIEDSAGNFVAIDVEGALAELFGTVESFLRATIDTAVNLTVVAPTDNNKLFNVTATATISLPPAATAGNGFVLAVFNASTTASDVVTVDASGTEAINNSFTVALAKGDWCVLTCTGVKWKALIYSPPSSSSFPTDLATYKFDAFLQYFGDGSDGAFNSVGASNLTESFYQHTTFTLNVGHTITCKAPVTIIKADTSITIDGTIDYDAANILYSSVSFSDTKGISGGGGGGSGGVNYTDDTPTDYSGKPGYTGDSSKLSAGGAGGAGGTFAASPTVGAAGSVVTTRNKDLLASLVSSFLGHCQDGGAGGAAGFGVGSFGSVQFVEYRDGSAGGKGAGLLILIAPTITISGTATVTSKGQAGTAGLAPGTNQAATGAGGGGAGGVVVLAGNTITNSGTFTLTGGSGGAAPTGGAAGGAGADGYVHEIIVP